MVQIVVMNSVSIFLLLVSLTVYDLYMWEFLSQPSSEAHSASSCWFWISQRKHSRHQLVTGTSKTVMREGGEGRMLD